MHPSADLDSTPHPAPELAEAGLDDDIPVGGNLCGCRERWSISGVEVRPKGQRGQLSPENAGGSTPPMKPPEQPPIAREDGGRLHGEDLPEGCDTALFVSKRTAH